MKRILAVLLGLAFVGCDSAPEPASVRLVERFDASLVEGTPAAVEAPSRTEIRFDGQSTLPPPDEHAATGGFRVIHGVRGLRVEDGLLIGTTEDLPIIAARLEAELDPDDLLHAVEIRMRASAGTQLGLSFSGEENLSDEGIVEDARQSFNSTLNVTLDPGEELATFALGSGSMRSSHPLADINHIILRPTEASGAEFAIESIRVVTRKEHLAGIESGVGWQGLSDVFRETLVARAPERIRFEVELPSRPFLELAIGTIEDRPVTFRVGVSTDDGETQLLRRTVTRGERWETTPLDLSSFAGRTVTLELGLSSEQEGAIGYWGAPVIRNRGGHARYDEASEVRDALLGEDAAPPQGVILIIADTLRRDMLQPYGHERENAPVLTRLAESGVLFEDNISQGAWTKVSVTSILTSLYPATHGVSDLFHRIPASVETLAEIYQSAGYATFATSSVPFTGKLTNLHQGVEVLHERGSVRELGQEYESKTGRPFTDRLLEWVELHREVPFFARLHVFDPHSPFRPVRPYDAMYLEPDAMLKHEEAMEAVKEHIEVDFFRAQSLPDEEELESSGVDAEAFVRAEKAWYDASIRAMDAEIGRLVERLEELGLTERVVLVFVSDHGEEFREHGRVFHGHSAYGEMLNVPLIFWGPGFVPSGERVAERVQSIDVMPTLLELSRLPAPDAVQGRSFLPLFLKGEDPGSFGWRERPVFAQAPIQRSEPDPKGRDKESFVIISDEWKLIKNTDRPEGWPELELYNHVEDPLNMKNLASEHADIVARLEEQLDNWLKAALAEKVSTEGDIEGMSPEDIERLRSLGYIQ